MSDPVGEALAHVRAKVSAQSSAQVSADVHADVSGPAPGRAPPSRRPVTLNFHPDVLVDGASVIDRLARDGVYRSQFETGISNGGLGAHPGGERWAWESRIFGGAYDGAAPALRPKYGALDHRRDPAGGSPRFGSCHLRLRRRVLPRQPPRAAGLRGWDGGRAGRAR